MRARGVQPGSVRWGTNMQCTKLTDDELWRAIAKNTDKISALLDQQFKLNDADSTAIHVLASRFQRMTNYDAVPRDKQVPEKHDVRAYFGNSFEKKVNFDHEEKLKFVTLMRDMPALQTVSTEDVRDVKGSVS